MPTWFMQQRVFGGKWIWKQNVFLVSLWDTRGAYKGYLVDSHVGSVEHICGCIRQSLSQVLNTFLFKDL